MDVLPALVNILTIRSPKLLRDVCQKKTLPVLLSSNSRLDSTWDSLRDHLNEELLRLGCHAGVIYGNPFIIN